MSDKKCGSHDNICEFCGKSFKTIYSLKVHMETAKYCLSSRGEKVVDSFKCEHCDHISTQKSALKIHHKTCLKLKDHLIETKDEEIQVLTKKNEKQSKIIKKMRLEEKIYQQESDKIEELQDKIAKLEKTIAYSKGYVEGYKTVKPPKQITNNNNTVVQKLKDLPVTTIAPLTITLIKSNLENYTYDMYGLAELGVVQFMRGLTILEMDDGTIEKNYVSSDRSRNAFHRLVVGKEWKSDAGARFLNTILNQIIPRVEEHQNKLTEEMDKIDVREITKRILLKKDMDLKPFYHGVTDAKSKDRVTVLTKIRTAIKDINHIDMISIDGL
jgi:hypothetical protein